jgi:type II secretory pathway pseudopilin PulG
VSRRSRVLPLDRVRVAVTRLRASATRDEGISLVELIVGILVLGIVSALIAGLFTSTMQVVTVSSALDRNTRMASNGMNEMSRIVRAGTPYPVAGAIEPLPAFALVKNEEFTIYAYVNLANSDQKPVKVKFSVENGSLVETTWKSTLQSNGYYTFGTSASMTRTLASSVVLPKASGSPYIFTYLDANGTPIAVPNTLQGLVGDDALRGVAAVTVTLTIQGSSTDTRSRVTLVNTVGIPNLGQNRVIS